MKNLLCSLIFLGFAHSAVYAECEIAQNEQSPTSSLHSELNQNMTDMNQNMMMNQDMMSKDQQIMSDQMKNGSMTPSMKKKCQAMMDLNQSMMKMNQDMMNQNQKLMKMHQDMMNQNQ